MTSPAFPVLAVRGRVIRASLPAGVRCARCREILRNNASILLARVGEDEATLVRAVCDEHRTYQIHYCDAQGRVVVTLVVPAWSGTPDLTFEAVLCDRLEDLVPSGTGFSRWRPSSWVLTLVARVRELAVARSADLRAVTAEDLAWTLAGWGDPADRAAGEACGLTPVVADSWIARSRSGDRFTPQEAVAWARAEVSMAEAFGWLLKAAVRAPQDRPEGLSLDKAHALRWAGLPLDSGWAGQRDGLCPDFALIATHAGAAPRDAARVGDLLGAASAGLGMKRCYHSADEGRAEFWCGWTEDGAEFATATARKWVGLDWAALAACLTVGMSVEQAEAHVRSGADMDPVLLTAALTG